LHQFLLRGISCWTNSRRPFLSRTAHPARRHQHQPVTRRRARARARCATRRRRRQHAGERRSVRLRKDARLAGRTEKRRALQGAISRGLRSERARRARTRCRTNPSNRERPALQRSGLPMGPAPRPERAQTGMPKRPRGRATHDHVPATTRTACLINLGARMPNEPEHRVARGSPRSRSADRPHRSPRAQGRHAERTRASRGRGQSMIMACR
jgi:hypothetical protein